MKNKMHSLLNLKPFDETADIENAAFIENSSIRYLVILLALVFAVWGFAWAIVDPLSENPLIVLGFSLSLKAIQILIEWHLGLKAMAKNGLIFVLFLTIIFAVLKYF